MGLLFLLAAVAAVSVYLGTKYRVKPSLDKKIKALQALPVQNWSTDFLQSKRSHTDPEADAVIDAILNTPGEEKLINTVFRAMVRNDDVVPANLPPAVHDYFALGNQLPSWADPELLLLGEQIYTRHGAFISLVLSCKSMPECYACAKGAMVLYHSGRLNDQQGAMDAYARRIVETAQFVVNAMSPGGLGAGGKGIRTAQKIRLIHAAIRYFIKKHGWDATLYDEPINQEDMAGTLMSFSALVLDGLKQLNINLSPTEEEAYQHCWRVLGHFMGVDADLLPNNVADARALGNAIMQHQVGPSMAGKSLTAALIKFKEDISPEGKLFGVVHEMLRYMMGDQVSNILEVPPADPEVEEKLKQRLRAWGSEYEKLEHRSELFAVFAESFSKIMLQGMLNYMNHEQKIYFYLPESLQKDWGVNEPV